MATLAEMLRQGADRLVNLPSEAQRFITNPQAFTQLLTGKNPLPRETGFAAGATGLPAQEMSVLDPNQAPYMQGYSQGEPIGYAGMAAPFAAPAAVATAKALAPKAGMMAENYMVRQGMIQPLTAYHGTPHTIQGQFDINKVGTGEGAQAYGHGMYFAENPAVATQYKNILSKPEFTKTGEGIELRGQLPRMLDESYDELVAKNGIQQTNYGDVTDIVGERLDRQMKDALKANDMDWYNKTADMKIDLARFRENPPPNVGNLYKVDIPDADIPMMLDWDKPLNKQSDLIQNVAKQLLPKIKQVSPNLDINKMTGQDFYRAYQRYRGNHADFASEGLNEVGIKGIRYLDEGSRVDFKYSGDPAYIYAGNSFKESGYTLKEAIEGMKKAYKNANPEELELAMNDVYGVQPKKTSNFVVFEPSQVKILEQNNKPVTRKELIQQQIDKIE
jgi:hypothetical protein